jgi:Fe2+ or Zn2+ uptake regulation protein
MADLLHAVCRAFFTPPGIYVLIVYLVALVSLVWATNQRMQIECVLRALDDEDATMAGMTGLELIRVSHKRLKPGTVYVVLNLLEAKDFVRSERMDTCSMRRKYYITDKGKNYYMSLIGA